MKALVDFTDYMVVVNRSLSSYSVECTDEIGAATLAVEKLMSSGESGVQALEKMFRTCAPLKSEEDKLNFFATLSGYFEGAVQYNKDNREFEVFLCTTRSQNAFFLTIPDI